MSNIGDGLSEEDRGKLGAVFRLLSDKTRLNILMILAEGECNVGALCRRLQLPQPTVSHHLGLLRAGGVIGSRRQGKQVFYNFSAMVSGPDGQVRVQITLDKLVITITPRGT